MIRCGLIRRNNKVGIGLSRIGIGSSRPHMRPQDDGCAYRKFRSVKNSELSIGINAMFGSSARISRIVKIIRSIGEQSFTHCNAVEIFIAAYRVQNNA